MTRSNRLIATVSAAVLAGAFSADAFAQLQPTPQPPPAKKTESGVKQRQESKKKAATAAKKTAPAEQKAKAADKAKTPAKSAAKPPEAEDDPHVDLAYGAYQRGAYGDALRIATRRAEAGDPKAMMLAKGRLKRRIRRMFSAMVLRNESRAARLTATVATRGVCLSAG